MAKKKVVHTGKLAIRKKRSGFSTIIPAADFYAHAEDFRDEWEVLNQFDAEDAEPEVEEVIEDQAEPTYTDAVEDVADDEADLDAGE